MVEEDIDGEHVGVEIAANHVEQAVLGVAEHATVLHRDAGMTDEPPCPALRVHRCDRAVERGEVEEPVEAVKLPAKPRVWRHWVGCEIHCLVSEEYTSTSSANWSLPRTKSRNTWKCGEDAVLKDRAQPWFSNEKRGWWTCTC